MVELKNIELATQKDRLYGIDEWAALFKSKSWEELKSMAAATIQFFHSCNSFTYFVLFFTFEPNFYI